MDTKILDLQLYLSWIGRDFSFTVMRAFYSLRISKVPRIQNTMRKERNIREIRAGRCDTWNGSTFIFY